MRHILFVALILLPNFGFSAEGNKLVSKQSSLSVAETVAKIVAAVNKRKGNIFIKIDYQKIAKTRGISIEPNQLLIIGKLFPKLGSGIQLIQADPLVGIDLPLKILVYRDKHQQVWVSYTAGDYFEKRYNIVGKEKYAMAIDRVMHEIVNEALID